VLQVLQVRPVIRREPGRAAAGQSRCDADRVISAWGAKERECCRTRTVGVV